MRGGWYPAGRGPRVASRQNGRRPPAHVGQGRAARIELSGVGGFVNVRSGKASNRPRTQDTGKVSHFARNQPGGVRSSSASPPSPHSPCLTGILTVQRLGGSGRLSGSRGGTFEAWSFALPDLRLGGDTRGGIRGASRFPPAVPGGGILSAEDSISPSGEVLQRGGMLEANAEEVPRCAEVLEGRAVGGTFGGKTSRFPRGAGRAWRGCVEGVRCPFIIGRARRAAPRRYPALRGRRVASR